MAQPSEHLTAVTLNIFRLNGILYEWGNRFAAPLGLNTSRWQVLGAVLLSETPPTVPQIAEKMGITRQGALKQVNVLIEEGLLAAQPNPAHQRAQLYVLTEKGQQAARQIQAHSRSHAEKVAEQFHPDDLAAAARVLGQLGQFYQDK